MGRILSFFVFMLTFVTTTKSQEISQFQVFAGRYDYVAFGNTMNLEENGVQVACEILTSSTADFELEADQAIIAAYLYWAGSGTGDFEVLLNDVPIAAQRTFSDQIDEARVFFAGFADVTEIVQTTGNAAYTVSELDLTSTIEPYCPTGTNFAGWAITVIYEDVDLPLNVVNVFDGLESVSATDNDLSIELENLNVLDNEDAKIGFVAWEGDAGLAVDETLSINGNVLSNPPLNPANNQFNGTNSFTGASDLFNMDIDVYTIEDNISIGDTSATIAISSGQDFVMINSIITVLNSQLPDAVIAIDMTSSECESRELLIDYTLGNIGTELLVSGVPITFYSNESPLETVVTTASIPAGGSITAAITLAIPEALGESFTLVAIADDDGAGEGIVNEINELNNDSIGVEVVLSTLPLNVPLIDLSACDQEGDGVSTFDLTAIGNEAIGGNTAIIVSYHLTEIDAQDGVNTIANPSVFENMESPQTIFLRFTSSEDVNCLRIESTILTVVSAPDIPIIDGLEQCDDVSNDGVGIFDFSLILSAILSDQDMVLVTFYESETDAISNQNVIEDIANYQNPIHQELIYVRLSREGVDDCFEITSLPIFVIPLDEVVVLPSLLRCNEGFQTSTFNLTEIEDFLAIDGVASTTQYFLSQESASQELNPIVDPFDFQNTTNPQVIFVRTEANDEAACPQFALFELVVENCPPFVPEGFSPNNDGINDVFEISGLKDVFLDHKLRIYSRLGNLVYEGTNDTTFWDGIPNRGILGDEVPVGVYFWVLHLNNPEFRDLSGWVYLNR